MFNPLVSILIPLYNAEKYFSETMESLLEQTYKNIEVIIVDDGSTDGSLALAKKYEDLYDQVKVYTQKNSGASVARNKALAQSKGTYIQYFDADDIMHPEKISSQINALRGYGFQEEIVATGKWVKFFNTIESISSKKQIINRSYNDMLLFLKESWENEEYIIGQSWLIHKKINEKIGGWNTRISVNDDGEFFAKVAYNATKIIYVENSLVFWRQDNSASLSKTKSWEGGKSQWLTIESYLNIVENNINYPGLKRALAIQCSYILKSTYPQYQDISNDLLSRIKSLGYSQPLYPTNKKFKMLVDLLGYKLAIRILNLYKNLKDKYL